MRAGWLAAALLWAAPVARSQPAMTVKELLARLNALRAATDFRASGRLVSVAASGQRRTYQISLRARWFADTRAEGLLRNRRSRARPGPVAAGKPGGGPGLDPQRPCPRPRARDRAV